MKIVLLGGLCYAGKSYIANLLCKESEAYFKTGFATALKDELHDAGIIDKKLLVDKGYKSGVRGIMQRYGQEKRAADPFYWARIVEGKIADPSPEGIVFIDDWRFKNEAQYFIDKGYPVLKIYIKRTDFYKLNSVGKAVLTDYYKNLHQDISEQELWALSKEWIDGAPYFDLIYYNNNDKDDKKIITDLMAFIKTGKAVKNHAVQS
jgi:hypothetical protein